MKTSEKLFFLPAIILLTAYLFKLGAIPNHVLVVAGSFLLIIIFLIIFLNKEMKKEKSFIRKVFHILFFLLILIVITLPFANMFSQGLVPIIIYCLMALGVIITS